LFFAERIRRETMLATATVGISARAEAIAQTPRRSRGDRSYAVVRSALAVAMHLKSEAKLVALTRSVRSDEFF
jgi:hypothetical protein